MPRRGLIPLFVALLFLTCFVSVHAFADSQVRIVRLSTVDGSVQIDRAIGGGYEKAMPNLPVTQGTKVRAQGEGRAEIEFEDRSTVRIVPGSVVEFPLLSLRDSGARATTVEVQEGTVYVSFAGSKGDEFAVTFGHETVRLNQAVHFRVQMNDTAATLAVFKGQLTIEGPSGNVELVKKQAAAFDLDNNDQVKVSKNVEELVSDEWDKRQDQYHDTYLARNSGLSPYSYGMSDLNYYGSFIDVAGYGTLWQPYFTGAGWDPFMDGAWCWYPGAGYMWVSAYPWGWLPYRYGSWMFVPGYGWGWQPGSTWGTWNTVPVVVNAPQGFGGIRPPAINAPVHNTLVVNRGIGVVPTARPGSKLVLQTNTAGLGIPRGSIRNPAQVSHEVMQRGSVTMSVRPQPAPMPTRASQPSWGNASASRGAGSSSAAGSNQRMSAPPAPAPAPMPHPAMSAPSGSSPHR